MPDYYPIMLNLRDKRCVVIGGGLVAERKVAAFLECGALVCVIGPELSPGLRALADKGRIEVVSRSYKEGDLKDAVLAVAATDNSEVNSKVFSEGQRIGVPVNVVDDLETSSFIVPSILRRGELLIAVSTSGRSPALARKIRQDLEERYEAEYASLVTLISEVRAELKERGIEIDTNAWQKSLDTVALLELLRDGDRERAKQRLLADLEAASRN
jgi:precorrin-2 dehydrogenase/sirohydrochlorin ferrochelatase